MAEKIRIDLLLVKRGLFPSREKARAAIMAGEITVDGKLLDKPGYKVHHNTDIVVREKMPYVSRGGIKLARALEVFKINLQGRLVLDIGASTGGFTDCALQNGAAGVYAVDVGYGQLAWSLRQNPKVYVLERTNIRYLEKDAFKAGLPDFITVDVSFISLELVLPRVAYLLEQYEGVALVKPQFEAGRALVGKKGVVKDPVVHRAVLHKVAGVVSATGGTVLGLDYSPVQGPKGNIEFLLHIQKPGRDPGDLTALIETTVETAHRRLKIAKLS